MRSLDEARAYQKQEKSADTYELWAAILATHDALVELGGAVDVIACASHGVLSGNATQRIEDSCIEELMVLNTIPLPADYTGKKIRQLDASPIFAKAITRIYNETSISSLF